MPIFDEMGTWEDLGVVSPVVDDWQFFPFFTNTQNSTFKLFFQGDIELLQNWKVSAWIRAVYFSGSQYFADQKWIRAFPKDEPEIIQIPYPPDIIKDPLPQRQIQCKRRIYYRNDTFKEANPVLGLQMQEKTDSKVVYPGQLYPVEEQTTT